MHQDLMPIVYRDLKLTENPEALVTVAGNNVDYLAKCLSDPQFLIDLDEAFSSQGQGQAEIKLFERLTKEDWASPQAPFLYRKIMDASVALADWSKAESAGREFLKKFPSRPESTGIRELLGDISYRTGDMAKVRSDLSWLLNPRARASQPESYYFLGKGMEAGGQAKSAGQAMGAFITAIRESSSSSPLLSDAHFVLGASLAASGDATKALTSYSTGLAAAPADDRDRFLYRIAELHRRNGRHDEAKKQWDKIVKDGTDPVWQKLATEALSDLEWKERTGSRI
jgi:tetratricopeptide (TPR) repeat protein